MVSTRPTPSEALAVAEAVLASRYADAAFAFAAGSIMRGQGTWLSDIDLVVVYDHLEAARRESFIAGGLPIEAFVHDPETLAWFVNADVARGCPSILNMVAEGVILGRAHDRAAALQRDVARRLAEGPPPLAQAQLNVLRYEITDAIDDLRGERSPGETMAIGAALHPRLAELALRGRGRWNGTGKWVPRLLQAADAGLADRFEAAFRALFAAGASDLVIALAEQELAPHGGRLFDGDCRAASPAWRA
ncbi:nucleotidyltransferase domain-containing protein [Bosea rubneri]|uniref:Nucleotidyltransferase domain-containing protein n=1 Tax=Bosea rubneri TaxID=3075434 RepID=A0ABU3SCX1_9HYPH|nr:nucleotidyltransferase domain-containing protein [Bosea sp. ZW T0_25]MDU0342210.1 nucleotidyltransferase domain-containing protein [Bosea sp. ZW T0_25]